MHLRYVNVPYMGEIGKDRFNYSRLWLNHILACIFSQSGFCHNKMDDLKTFSLQQNSLVELLFKNMSISSRTNVSYYILTPDSIANSLNEFIFDPKCVTTFEAWFKRHQDLYTNDFKEWNENSKLRLLLQNLRVSEH